MKELISDQQRAELSHVEGLQEKVQQKIAGMKRTVSELDQFMTTEDHIHFLQVCEDPPKTNSYSDQESDVKVPLESMIVSL